MVASTTRPRGSGTPPQEAIVAAALSFIDEHGLEKFSINALAAEMGIFQPNVYRRVAHRQELMDLIVDAIMSEAGLPEVDPADWHAWLIDWALRVRRAWGKHPRAGALIQHGGTQSRGAMESVIGVFLGAFPAEFVPVAVQAYLGQVFGTTLLELRGLAAHSPVDPTEIDLTELPHLVQYAMVAAQRGYSPEQAEQDFLQGLTLLLDGLRPHASR